MTRLYCRFARFEDFSAIYDLQKAFFDSRKMPIQHRKTPTSWCVCVTGDEEVVGCYSYTNSPHYPVRCVQDFYRVKGASGTRSIRLMWEHMEALAALDEVDITFVIEPYNLPWMQQLLKRKFSMIGVQFFKKVRPSRTLN